MDDSDGIFSGLLNQTQAHPVLQADPLSKLFLQGAGGPAAPALFNRGLDETMGLLASREPANLNAPNVSQFYGPKSGPPVKIVGAYPGTKAESIIRDVYNKTIHLSPSGITDSAALRERATDYANAYGIMFEEAFADIANMVWRTRGDPHSITSIDAYDILGGGGFLKPATPEELSAIKDAAPSTHADMVFRGNSWAKHDPAQVLDSDALWSLAPDHAAQVGQSVAQSFADLANDTWARMGSNMYITPKAAQEHINNTFLKYGHLPEPYSTSSVFPVSSEMEPVAEAGHFRNPDPNAQPQGIPGVPPFRVVPQFDTSQPIDVHDLGGAIMAYVKANPGKLFPTLPKPISGKEMYEYLLGPYKKLPLDEPPPTTRNPYRQIPIDEPLPPPINPKDSDREFREWLFGPYKTPPLDESVIEKTFHALQPSDLPHPKVKLTPVKGDPFADAPLPPKPEQDPRD